LTASDINNPFDTLDSVDPLEAEYIKKMEQNRGALHFNLQVIEAIIKGEAALVAAYPCLYKWLTSYRNSNGNKWKALHVEALKHPQTLADKNGWPIFFASYQYLADIYGGQRRTWMKFIPMLSAFGLIDIIQPKEKGRRNTRTQNRSVRMMQAKQALNVTYKHPINYYHLPLYSETLLAKAESELIRFVDGGGNAGGFSKAMLIDIYGQFKANMIADNYWKKTPNQLETEATIEATLTHFLQLQGYATRDEVIHAVRHSTGMSVNAINTHYSRCIHLLMEKYQLVTIRIGKRNQAAMGITSDKSFVYILKQAE